MKIKAKLEGREAVMKRLRALLPDTEAELAEEQLEGAQELAARIKPRAPGDGTYRSSIQADRLSNRPGQNAIRKGAKGQTKDPNATGIFADYRWRWLEYGTNPRFNKMGAYRGVGPAMPHIFPTYRAYRKKLRKRMANAVNRAVRKARKSNSPS